jgi:hypothetical protein
MPRVHVLVRGTGWASMSDYLIGRIAASKGSCATETEIPRLEVIVIR